jgi:hypothetical protein
VASGARLWFAVDRAKRDSRATGNRSLNSGYTPPMNITNKQLPLHVFDYASSRPSIGVVTLVPVHTAIHALVPRQIETLAPDALTTSYALQGEDG